MSDKWGWIVVGAVIAALIAYWIFPHDEMTIQHKDVQVNVKSGSPSGEGWKMKEVTLPVFDGDLIMRLYADEAFYEKGKPVLFKNPIIYHYGITKITRIAGKHGELHLVKGMQEVDFANMKVWGNLHIEQRKTNDKPAIRSEAGNKTN